MKTHRSKTPRRRFHRFHLETVWFLLVAGVLSVSFLEGFRPPKNIRPAPTGFRMEFTTAAASEQPDLVFGLQDDPYLPDVGQPPETNAERDAWKVYVPGSKRNPRNDPARFPVSATEVSVSPAPPMFSGPSESVSGKTMRVDDAHSLVDMTLFYGSDDALPIVVIEDGTLPFAVVPTAEARAFATPAGFGGTNLVFRTKL